ncbi:hypothetical protein D1AOALGA4SA_9049 [Olavius algarvensis Delta 1 endosymbiont]|nr:hypothetical protein D1AOALGA4SA_9049 [Olavius algarvensis Delta 1 endosymbiont]
MKFKLFAIRYDDYIVLTTRRYDHCTKSYSKDPGPEDPALSSPQRGGVYLGLQME